MDHQQILTLALQLPAEQREEIAERLFESLRSPINDEVEAAWAEEVE
jgi:hypothetical protein